MIILALAAAAALSGISAQEEYSSSPFDDHAEHLAAAYRGANLPRLFYALRDLQEFKKGEFEKTDAFQARLRKRLDSPIYGGLKVDSTIAVPLAATPKYDADKETLRVQVDFNTREWIFTTAPIGGISFVRSGFENQPELVRPLPGTGGETVIEKTYYVLWLTNFNALQGIVHRGSRTNAVSDDSLVLGVKMSPQVASELKARWRVVCVMNLAPVIESSAKAPAYTVESAYQGDAPFRERYLGVLAHVKSIWLYDYETGTVYGRL